MVLVSHRHRFIYIKTIKSASTSVEAVFQRFCGSADYEAGYELCHSTALRETADGVISARIDRDSFDGSIAEQRLALGADGKWRNHMTLMEVEGNLGAATVVRFPVPWPRRCADAPPPQSGYTTFAVVRNPWDLVVSYFAFFHGAARKGAPRAAAG